MEPNPPERPEDRLVITDALSVDQHSLARLNIFLQSEIKYLESVARDVPNYSRLTNHNLGLRAGLAIARFNESKGEEISESGFIHFAEKGGVIVGYEVTTINREGVVNAEAIGVAWSERGINVARELLKARHRELKDKYGIKEYEIGVPVGRYDGIKLMIETAGAHVGDKIRLPNGQERCTVYLTEE